jgi:FKBP-type peptidyl-prolyl cis-trans isomerase FkpA
MTKNWLGFLPFAIGLFSTCLSNDTFNSKVQFKTDTSSIGSFLRENKIDAAKTPEGVWYVIDDVGLGVYPVLSDSVKISYTAWDIQSSVRFNSSPALTKLLSSAISGLQIGLPRFPAGSYGRLYVPSGLGYGTTGNDSIPSNKNLLFKIKLLSTVGNRFPSDTSAIRSYINLIVDSLSRNKIAVHNIGGVHYSYDTLGDNASYPSLSDSIDVNYKGNILNSKSFFVNASNTTLVLKNQITAFKLVLPKISVGATATIYVPSGYGYGSVLNPPDTTIAPNSNLIYQVKLIKVRK